MPLIWVLLSLGCGGDPVDPQLASLSRSVRHWEQAEAELRAGRTDQALVLLDKALADRPRDAVLRAWKAKALADAGDLDGAIAELDTVLFTNPGFSEARYNRAAYQARAGRPEGAARDLEQALDEGVRPAADAIEDPDFGSMLDHPAFDFLPSGALSVGVKVPEGPVFLGSEFTVAVEVFGARGTPVGVTVEEATGPARLFRSVEESTGSTRGPIQELRWTFRAEGAGQVKLGPFQVWAGSRRARVDGVTVTLLAPPGRGEPPPELPPLSLSTPTEVVAGRTAPHIRVADGHVEVLTAPGDVVRAEPPLSRAEAVTWEKRDQGRPYWTLRRYPVPDGVVPDIRIQRDGAEVARLDPE